MTKEVQQQKNSLNEKESLLSEREGNINNLIDTRAKELSDAVEERLKKEYEKKNMEIEHNYSAKKHAIYSVTLIAIIYGFTISTLKMLSSQRMRSDIVVFFGAIFSFISKVYQFDLEGIIGIKELFVNGDDYRLIILSILFVLIIYASQVAAIIFVARYAYVVGKWAYDSDKFDFTMAVISLVSMAIIVWIADYIDFIDSNLVCAWLLLQVTVIIVRGIMENI